MALVLNQEQDMLRESALQFMKERAPVAQLRGLRDSRGDDGFSRATWASFAEMGFTGVLVPEEYGGLGLGMVEAGAIMEAIGRNLTAVPFFSTAVLGAALLARHGSTTQQARCLPAIAAGEMVVALAVDESVKHRPEKVALRAEQDGDGYLLRGEKLFVVDGHVADQLIVSARTDEGVTLFLVDGAAAGVRRERSVMVDAHNAARIVFDGVRVGSDAVIGAVGQGTAPLDAVLDIGRVALAGELLGIAEEVFERTVVYLKERRQFGQIIGEFQALQHRASMLYTDIEITRALVLGAQQALDDGAPNAAALVSAAKARAGTTATTAVQEGVQMHGGIGMTDEFEIGFFMKRARVVDELLGDARFHADRWAASGAY